MMTREENEENQMKKWKWEQEQVSDIDNTVFKKRGVDRFVIILIYPMRTLNTMNTFKSERYEQFEL